MDLELLRTFLEVERLRHFGQAAEALHLTQAAVSARIKLLENTLGVKLFDRQRKDIQVTPEGHRLIRYADLLISDWRKARQDVALGAENQQISIGGSLRLWDMLLQGWFHQLRQEMPDLAIIAELHSPDLLTRRLLDGVLDVAFMLEPAQLDVLQIEQVATLELLMVCAEAGMNAEQALQGTYLMVDWGLAHALQHRRLFPDAPEPQIRVSQAQMALGHLLELGGAAYLPRTMVETYLAEQVLFTVEDAPIIERHAYAVYPVRSAKHKLIQQALRLFDH